MIHMCTQPPRSQLVVLEVGADRARRPCSTGLPLDFDDGRL